MIWNTTIMVNLDHLTLNQLECIESLVFEKFGEKLQSSWYLYSNHAEDCENPEGYAEIDDCTLKVANYIIELAKVI